MSLVAAGIAVLLLPRAAAAAAPWYFPADSIRVTGPRPGPGGTIEARGEARLPVSRERVDCVSLTGMTGFVNTPWAGVIAAGAFDAGYNFVPRRWAYGERGASDDHVFYATLGLLPRVETAVRLTRSLRERGLAELVRDARLADADRMASARVELLPPRSGRPGLAVGIEDVRGSRRFHSTYAVAGMPFPLLTLRGRAAAGYGFRPFTATRHVLDGAFGALEVSPRSWLRAQLEYDSEKWNAALGCSPGAGFRLRAALLHLESLSLGAGWSYRF